MRVLVVNAGSSSLKLRLLDGRDELLGAEDLEVSSPPERADPATLEAALVRLGRADAVGHRIVHGGTEFREAVVIDASVAERLRALTDLAPLHQPKSLDALDAVSASLPDVPSI